MDRGYPRRREGGASFGGGGFGGVGGFSGGFGGPPAGGPGDPPVGGPGGPRRRFRSDFDPEEYAPRRKLHGQRPVDFYSPAIRHVLTRLVPRSTPYSYHVAPHEYYTKDLVTASVTNYNASTALCTQWVNTSYHPDSKGGRIRTPLYALQWSPSGRRLLCSTGRGEFLLFNGQSFGVEVKTVAHEDNRPCRAIAWGRRHDLILSGDDAGKLKMWMSNFVFMSEVDTSHRAVREISWAPLELKFCTAGQDGSAKVWDTNTVGAHTATTGASDGNQAVLEEVKLEGHGGDVTTAHWHPIELSLPPAVRTRSADCGTPHSFSRQHRGLARPQPGADVRAVAPDGRTLLSASKDGTVKLWDIRKTQPERRGVIERLMAAQQPAVQLMFGLVKYWTRNKPGALEEKERGVESDILDEQGQVMV
ncbi:WD domain, G-beta repeat family protein [Leishmania donovani]|uniref:WD domain, G-beta repeat family protein n=1 Tax=Leishmania donovani TaxID=5661 RepID=A0A504X3H1_LEIDO|nr:WD domain, G-beta repeat family protein [Leishmania donovani]